MQRHGKHFVRTSDPKNGDFFATDPRWVSSLLDVHAFGDVWEPACGDGAISKELERRGINTTSTDLFDRGYGKAGVDFLNQTKLLGQEIITNPPFSLFMDFWKHAWELKPFKFAFLAPWPYLGNSQSRYRELWSQYPPHDVILVNGYMKVNNKLSMYPHCWCVWYGGMQNLKKTALTFAPHPRGK